MVAALGVIGAVTTALPIVGKVLDAINPLLDRFFPNPEEREKVRNELISTLVQSDIAQLEVNKAEAQTGSLYMAGWRPGFGWLGLFLILWWNFLAPLIEALIQIRYPGFQFPPVPALLADNMWTIIFGMLGLGGMRSFDKFRGVDTKSIAPVSRDPKSLGDAIRSGK